MKGAAARGVTWAVAAVLLALVEPSSAQQRQIVDGVIINFGIVTTEEAFRAQGHREAHPFTTAASSRHLLVTLDDQKSGTRIGNADVVIEVTDPSGGVERKTLLHTQAAGLPDYSELFDFAISGDYSVRVIVALQPGAKPIETVFKTKRSV